MTCSDMELKRNGVNSPYLRPFSFIENAFSNQLLLYREIIRFRYDTDMVHINSPFEKTPSFTANPRRACTPLCSYLHRRYHMLHLEGKFSTFRVIYCNMLSSFHI
jgi:hypothetical protein